MTPNRDNKGRFISGHKVNAGKKNAAGKHWKLSRADNERKSALMKGKPSSMTGKKWSKESRSRFSEKCRGDKGNNWKGGVKPIHKIIRAGVDFALWREAVFTRDNWTCQRCKNRGFELHPHHLMNFSEHPDLRFVVENGVTFCMNCHINFHKLYGWTGNTDAQVKEYLWTH